MSAVARPPATPPPGHSTIAKAGPLRRWTSVLLRTAHLVAVIGFSTHFLVGDDAGQGRLWALTILASGMALFVLDFWMTPGRLLELSAASVAVKLALVVAMVVLPQWQRPLFWTIVVWSVIFAHAPASFRHARLRLPIGGV